MPSAWALARTVRAADFVQRFDFRAVDADAAADFDDLLIQHRGQGDGEVEQARAGLVADAQGVGETLVHQQQGAVALALQQRVGGDGGAHFDRLDLSGRDRFIRANAEDRFDAGDGGVLVALGVLRQQLMGGQCAVGMARDDVGEGAAAVDPELPHRAVVPWVSFHMRTEAGVERQAPV